MPPAPHFFVDRSLGRLRVPGALRAAGWSVTTLAEHYGQRLERYREAAQGYVDDKLREIFPRTRGFADSLPAHLFLARRRRARSARIARWSGMTAEDIGRILDKLSDRGKA